MKTTENAAENLSPRLEQLLTAMEQICNDLAWGQYDRVGELFKLTLAGDYPQPVARLAESFGMMLVKVEAREYRLDGMVTELRRVGEELKEARQRLLRENQGLKQGLVERYSAKRIVGQSPAIRAILGQVKRIADTSVSVLITGETGTGKELLAKALHYNSRRKAKPFIALNCSAVPETLFERELFGIEKGVATGVTMHRGLLEQAQGGTLLLDEIGDMPLVCQSKMLRVLEERELTRLGGTHPVPLDVRILAATNTDMDLAVQNGAFRRDLFYRLNVISLHLPPLRERPEDIPPLAHHFLKVHSQGMGRERPCLDKSVLKALSGYDWPGNVRELSNEMERLVALSFADKIRTEDLSTRISGYQDHATDLSADSTAFPVTISPSASVKILPRQRSSPAESSDPALVPCREASPPSPAESVPLTLAQTEKLLIQNALEATGGNKTQAARLLGISREGLRKKLKRLPGL